MKREKEIACSQVAAADLFSWLAARRTRGPRAAGSFPILDTLGSHHTHHRPGGRAAMAWACAALSAFVQHKMQGGIVALPLGLQYLPLPLDPPGANGVQSFMLSYTQGSTLVQFFFLKHATN